MNKVDVIIPSFNRAGILSKTLPSYLQDNVSRLILVDDFSSDNTRDVVLLLAKADSRIEYYRSPNKVYQTGAKNFGLKVSCSDYIYFGDDDSILKAGSISAMLAMAVEDPMSIIAARHIYLQNGESVEDGTRRCSNFARADNLIFDKNNMKLDLSYLVTEDINLPFCQACFMVSRQEAIKCRFDSWYFGTCFREETDYIISLRKSGLSLTVCNEALQVNLPRNLCSGGTASVSPYLRHYSEVMNEFHFFQKNGVFLKKFVNFSTNPYVRSASHFGSKVMSVLSGNMTSLRNLFKAKRSA